MASETASTISSFCLCCIKINFLEQACMEARQTFLVHLKKFQQDTAEYVRNTNELANNLWKLATKFNIIER